MKSGILLIVVFEFLFSIPAAGDSALGSPNFQSSEILDNLSNDHLCKLLSERASTSSDRIAAEFSDNPDSCNERNALYSPNACARSFAFRRNSFGIFIETPGPDENTLPYLSSIQDWKKAFEYVTKTKFDEGINLRDQFRQNLFTVFSNNSLEAREQQFVDRYIANAGWPNVDTRKKIFEAVINGADTSCRSESSISKSGEIEHTHTYIKSDGYAPGRDLCVFNGFFSGYGAIRAALPSVKGDSQIDAYMLLLADLKLFYSFLERENYFQKLDERTTMTLSFEASINSTLRDICGQ